MDYYYKYLKYKTKYLELKGGKMGYKGNILVQTDELDNKRYHKPFGLYGLYGHKTIIVKKEEVDVLNERKKQKKFIKENIDPRLPNKEINYIHDLPIYEDDDIDFEDNVIIKHLLSKCSGNEYYSGIESFQFIPYEKNINIEIDEEKKISEFIKDTYFVEDMLRNNNIETDWLTINKYKRRRYRGLDLQQSEKYVNEFSKQAYKMLKKKIYLTTNKSLNKQRRENLINQKKRRCKNLYNNYTSYSDGNPFKPLLLENELIENDKKQYLLSDFSLGVKYANNPKLSKDAYISATSKLGKSGYNIMINKATIGCIANYNNMLFPIRIILDMNPNIMFYENIYERIYLRFIEALNKLFSKNELEILLLLINNNKKITINNNEDIKNNIKILDTILLLIKNKDGTNKNKILNKYIRKYTKKNLKKKIDFTISNLKILDILNLLYQDTNIFNDLYNNDKIIYDDTIVEMFRNVVNIVIIKKYKNLEQLNLFILKLFKYNSYNDNNKLKQSIINLFNYIFMIYFNNNYQYLGFWLLRFKNNYKDFENIDDELKYVYDPTNSKPHDSREQYYIFFVFRDNQYNNMGIFFATYPNVNFRNNKIDVGSVVELKKILYHEILQLLCLYYRKQIYFYIILKTNIYNELNCNLQNQYFNSKDKYSKCVKVWFSKESEKFMKDNKFDIENNEIHILVSNKNIDEIHTIKKYEKKSVENINYLEINDYCLFECYFDYEELDINNYKTDRFVIKLGNNKKILNNTCINDDELLHFEDIRRTINFAYNIYENETKDKFYY
jgi:hypothetical protein